MHRSVFFLLLVSTCCVAHFCQGAEDANTTSTNSSSAPPPALAQIDRFTGLDIVLYIAFGFSLLVPNIPSLAFCVSRVAAVSRAIVPAQSLLDVSNSVTNETLCGGFRPEDAPLFLSAPLMGSWQINDDACSGQLLGTVVSNVLIGLGVLSLGYLIAFLLFFKNNKRLPIGMLEVCASDAGRVTTRFLLILLVAFFLPGLLSAAVFSAARCAHGLSGAIAALLLFVVFFAVYAATLGRERKEAFRFRKLTPKSISRLPSKSDASLIQLFEPRGYWKWLQREPDSKAGILTKSLVHEREKKLMMMMAAKKKMKGAPPPPSSQAPASPGARQGLAALQNAALRQHKQQQQQQQDETPPLPVDGGDADLDSLLETPPRQIQKQPRNKNVFHDSSSSDDSDVPPDESAVPPKHITAGSSIPSGKVQVETLPKTRRALVKAVSAANAFASAGKKQQQQQQQAQPVVVAAVPPVILTDSDSDDGLPPPPPRQPVPPETQRQQQDSSTPADQEEDQQQKQQQPKEQAEDKEERDAFLRYRACLPVFDQYCKNDFWFILVEVGVRLLYVVALVAAEFSCAALAGTYAGISMCALFVLVFVRQPFTCKMTFYAVVLSVSIEVVSCLFIAVDPETGATVGPPLLMGSLIVCCLMCVAQQIYLWVAPSKWPDTEWLEFDFDPDKPREKPKLPPPPAPPAPPPPQQAVPGLPRQAEQQLQQQQQQSSPVVHQRATEREAARLLAQQREAQYHQQPLLLPSAAATATAAGPKSATLWNNDSDVDSALDELEALAVSRTKGAAAAMVTPGCYNEDDDLDLFTKLDRRVRAAFHDLVHEDDAVLPAHDNLKRAREDFEALVDL